jgi:hypothetical protein
MRTGLLAVVAVCFLSGGCDEAAMMKKFTPPADEALAREYAQALQQEKFDRIEHDLDPSLKTSFSAETFSKMAALFPADDPQSSKVVGAHTNRTGDRTTSDITLEYEFPNKWLLVNVVTQKTGDVSTLVGMRVTPIPDSLENLNRFTLAGKSFLQYFTLLCAIGSLLFTFYVFGICIRTTGLKRKWLWLIGVLIGVGYFGVNWNTGQWTFQIFAFQIPCFSMKHGLYEPWIVGAYFAVGAIFFLHRRWEMRVNGELIPEVGSEKEIEGRVSGNSEAFDSDVESPLRGLLLSSSRGIGRLAPTRGCIERFAKEHRTRSSFGGASKMARR